MKLSLILMAFVLLAACRKDAADINSNNCISLIAAPELSATDSMTVAALMNSNGQSTQNLVFNGYQAYNSFGQNNQQVDVQIATATQEKNGLPIFFYDVTFGFENSTLDGPVTLRAENFNLDTRPTLPLQKLAQSFLVQAQGMDQVSVSFKDSCLVAQFGYYDLNIDFPSRGANFVKAWFVHPKNSQWPQGYFRDDNGAAILFKPLTNGNVP